MQLALRLILSVALALIVASPTFAAPSRQTQCQRLSDAVVRLGSEALEGLSRGTTITATAGRPIVFNWQLSPAVLALREARCAQRLVVLFDFDRVVRFQTGPIATLPGSKGLYKIDLASNKTRAFFEIPTDSKDTSLQLSTTFWELGVTQINVAIFFVENAGKATVISKLIARVEKLRVVDVSAGSYTIAAADAFDATKPLRVLQTRSQRYILHDYGQFFRVFSSGGDPVLFGSGRNVNFSPHGRFLSAIFDHGVDVYDLDAGRLINRHRLEGGVRDWNITALGWTEADSFLIMSWSGAGGIAIVPTLVDDVEWRTGHGLDQRREEPGHAQSISLSLALGRIDTRYQYASLIELARSKLTPVRTNDLFKVKTDASSPESWNRVNWPLDGNFRLSHDFSDDPQPKHIEAHIPLDTFVATPTRRGTPTPFSGAHRFYLHRSGTPMYIRYGALFDLPAPIDWEEAMPERLNGFLKTQGLELGAPTPLSKVYSTNPDDLQQIIADIEKTRVLSNRRSAARTTDRSVASFYSLERVPRELFALQQFFATERASYQMGYSSYATDKILTPTTRSNLVFFPNAISQRYQYLAHFAFLSLIERASFAKELVYLDLPEWEKENLSSEERSQIQPEKSGEPGCTGSDGRLPRVLPWAVRDAWTGKVGDEHIWVFQSSCTEGLRGDWQFGQITVVQESNGKVFKAVVGAERCPETTAKCNYLSAELASLQVTAVDGRYLVLKGYNNTVIVYDLREHKIVARAKQTTLGPGALVRVSRDAHYILFVAPSGELVIVDTVRQTELVRGVFLDDEIILYTQDGRFTATEDGASYVRVKFAGIPELQSLKQFRRFLFRPDLLSVVGQSVQDAGFHIPAPPTVSIAVRGAEAETGHSILEIAAPPYVSLSTLYVFADGRLLKKVAVGNAGVTRLETIGLVRTVEVQRIAENGAESSVKSLRLNVDAKGGRLFVLAAGISSYADSRIPGLTYGESDARKFCNVALSGLVNNYSSVIDMTAQCQGLATVDIRDRLESAVEMMDEADTLVFFFSGHGVRADDGGFFLLTAGSDLDNLERTAISWRDVLSKLRRAKGRVVLFLDACHSGQAGRLLTNDELVDALSTVDEVPLFVIAASKGRQKSWEPDTLAGGVFASFLIHILSNPERYDRDGDGHLTIGELFYYLRAKVSSFSGDVQTPWLSRNFDINGVSLF